MVVWAWFKEQTIKLRTLPLVPSPTGPYMARGDSGICMCILSVLCGPYFPMAFRVPHHLPVCRQLHTDSPAQLHLDSIWTWRNAHTKNVRGQKVPPHRGSNSGKYTIGEPYTLQWWFVNPGSDSQEISLVRTKSVGNKFHVRTYGRFSNPENSFIRKYWTGTNVSGLTNHHCTWSR